MTNKQKILKAFKANRNKITLGYALRHSWGYRLVQRLWDLRQEGYRIDFTRGSRPTLNTYCLLSKPQ